ncbi:FAD-dependent oxidoreductase [Streptomyces melanogenes]|uniref:FAD-dependent oxidoreductase n=1 Tax=Streptomyces melanogenes TaxID=67326 RepID=UPI0019ACB682|nr:FAD-dependent oxidoreductase [Streptomyces melanogenes]GGP80299.1 oxidoreductase [Streptomyces melanogenes]
MNALSYDADLLVVGAGPAGVAAALMASSLGLRTMVLEGDIVGGRLHTIGSLENVPGGWTTGPQLAEALIADLTRLQQAGLCTLVQERATKVGGYADRAEVALADGRTFLARTIVVATGVAALAPRDVDWVSAPDQFSAPPLWRTPPAACTGPTFVLGGDRPLGTWLRAHADAGTALHVLYPPTDDYKIEEVSRDERVRLLPVSHVTLARLSDGDGWRVLVTDRQGARHAYAAATVVGNLGSKPAAPEGVVQGEDGYCPPQHQHHRIRIAGDLRSSRFQRIVTAQGSAAECVLAHYYASASPVGKGGVQ